eukprot:1457141-Ditylum_brightwellii.AAC.1
MPLMEFFPAYYSENEVLLRCTMYHCTDAQAVHLLDILLPILAKVHQPNGPINGEHHGEKM